MTTHLTDYVNDTCTCTVGNDCDHIDLARIYKLGHAQEETGIKVGEEMLWTADRKVGGYEAGDTVPVTVLAVFASLTGLPTRVRIEYRTGNFEYTFAVEAKSLEKLGEWGEKIGGGEIETPEGSSGTTGLLRQLSFE